MRVIGTAGHVDHGKSTLVQALTGMNPDRLREERERQMTIDLGFAWMTLPGGEEVGIIDVPGHRDFIENMLAGVGGIDAALLIIAADEGVMPQTREHLAILDLLQVHRAVVALAKLDLVRDAGWLQLVQEEARQLLEGSGLAGSPIVPLSAVSGEGLAELKASLVQVLASAPRRRDLGRPRLPVDRAFSMSGFGTVVTGTLVDGSLEVGQEVEILPSGLRARVRGLQTHKTAVQAAVPGSRVAANLAGVEVRQIRRGDVLVPPAGEQATRRLDVSFRLLSDAPQRIQHDRTAKLFLGAAQRMARARLLGVQELQPGEQGWLQLELDEPVIARRGDRFILRRASPGATLGGGVVADPHPGRRHRRFDPETLTHLQRLLSGKPAEVLQETLAGMGVAELGTALQASGLDPRSAELALKELLRDQELIVIGAEGAAPAPEQPVMARRTWDRMVEQVRHSLEAYHRANPVRAGMPQEQLKRALGVPAHAQARVLERLVKAGQVAERDGLMRLPDFQVRLTAEQRQAADALLDRFRGAPYATPSWKESLEAVGEDLLNYLLESGALVRLSEDVLLGSSALEGMVRRVRSELESRGQITVAEVRDLFSTSRKYALALMEHLDRAGMTQRQGDVRRLRQPKGEQSAAQPTGR
jgi:selenocysteine-specific elongation factor